MNANTLPHSRRDDNNECALVVVDDLSYNTFSSGDASIDLENWLYDYRNDVATKEEEETESPGAVTTQAVSEKIQASYESIACPDTANTFWGTVLHIYVISTGPALFLMPAHFFAVGYFSASALVFVIFFVYWHCVRMVIWTEAQVCQIKHRQHMTYPETVFHCFDLGPNSVRWFAPYSYVLVRILFVVTRCGVFELVMVASNLRIVCLSAFDLHLDVHSSMLVIFVPMLLLTCIHRLKYLVPLSMLADTITLFCILTVILHVILDPQPLSIEPHVGSLEDVPFFLGSTLYALNATALMLPVKNGMKERRRFNAKWASVLNLTFPFISFIYALFGLFCSLKFGSRLLQYDTVIECLGVSKQTLEVTVSLYTLSIALQYPLITYAVFDTIWSGFLRSKPSTMKRRTCCEYAIRTLVYLASFLIGYSLPQLNLILAICGTICLAFDSLLFPALINSLMMWKLNGNVRKVKVGHVKNGFIGLIAVLVVYAGLYVVVVSQIVIIGEPNKGGNNTD